MRGLFTVAKWEILRSRGVINKESTLVFVIILLLLALFTISASNTQIEMNDKIYTVAIVEDEYLPLLSSDNRFKIIVTDRDVGFKALEEGKVDILISGGDAYLYDLDMSHAALSALQDTSKSYKINFLSSEVEYANLEFYDAFPVWIRIDYLKREEGFALPSIKESEEVEIENIPLETPSPTTTSTTGSITGDTTTAKMGDPESSRRSETLKERLFEGSSMTTPSELTPPLPFTSILISFIFIFPLYFLTQLYSSSIMEERINRRGEFLLVSPVKTWELVLGKLLPYLILSVLIMIAILIYLERTPMEIFEIVMIILPVALFFLAIFFIAGILTRSFKELTFISVFFAAITSAYLFFPAVFMNIHAISTISPMTLVIRILEGGGTGIQEYLFSTLPFYLTSLVIFAGGISIFREEDLFTEKPVREKILDIFDLFLRRGKMSHICLAVLLLSVFLIPFAYMAELMSISLLFSIPLPYSVIGIIIVAASAEEIIKSTGPATVFIRGIAKPNLKNALLLGIFSGLGFFLAEKLLLLVTITSITGSIFGASIFFTGKLLLPLVLHTTTAIIPALGIYRYGRRGFLPFLILSVIAHSLYNLTIVRGYIFG